MTRLRFILILVALGACQPCAAGTATQRKGDAVLEIRYDPATPTLTLADLVTITLTVEGPPSLHPPVAPIKLPAAAPWDLVEPASRTKEKLDAMRVRYRVTYRFAPREPGKKVPFHFPDIKLRDGDSDEEIVTWTPISFDVEATLGDPEREALRDITAIEDLPPVVPAERTWLWWLALAGVVLLLSATVLGVRSLWRRTFARTPTQLARYELDRLVALKLPETGRSERFITLLTALVRRYLERQFALPARRQTTPEFVIHVEGCALLTATEKEFLTTFLQRCDAVKFGQQTMAADECARWAEATRRFLEARLPLPA